MSQVILSIVITCLLAIPAMAQNYAGPYQVKDPEGKLLFEGTLLLTRNQLGPEKWQHIYSEVNGQGKVMTIKCIVDDIDLGDGLRQYTEDCENYGISKMVCTGARCSGTVVYDDFGDGKAFPISETQTRGQFNQSARGFGGIDSKNLENLQSYHHQLKRQ